MLFPLAQPLGRYLPAAAVLFSHSQVRRNPPNENIWMPLKSLSPSFKDCAISRTTHGAVIADEIDERGGSRSQRPDPGSGTATLGKSEQGRQARRTGQPADDSRSHAVSTQVAYPLQKRRCLEKELRHQGDLETAASASCTFSRSARRIHRAPRPGAPPDVRRWSPGLAVLTQRAAAYDFADCGIGSRGSQSPEISSTSRTCAPVTKASNMRSSIFASEMRRTGICGTESKPAA